MFDCDDIQNRICEIRSFDYSNKPIKASKAWPRNVMSYAKTTKKFNMQAMLNL